MKLIRLAGFGLVLAVVALSGCVQPPTPQVAVAPAPVAVPPPVPPPLVALMPPPAPPRHHVVRVAHPVIHHHWMHRYYSAGAYYAPAWSPRCGSIAHPCTAEHVTVPIQ
jgi:hypothetical protein